MMKDEIMVSICCTAYNHEKYIRQTLEGFLMQKTDFKYEIVIHDDASTDETANIIHEYEIRYPDIICPIYQIENQYSKGTAIIRTFMAPKTRGKYIALCEGDDCWNNPNKLQRQVNALKSEKECFMCVHRVEEVKEDGTKTGVLFPKAKLREGMISSEDFLSMTFQYTFHTSSYMFDGDKWREYCRNPPAFQQTCPVGDEAYMLYFGQLGNIYYISDTMSCYRRGVPSSWSKLQNTGNVAEKKIRRSYQMNETLLRYDEYTNQQYHDICNKRRAYYLKTARLLEGRTADFFKKNSRELLNAFPLHHKVILAIAAVFPHLAQNAYRHRMMNVNKRNGY